MTIGSLFSGIGGFELGLERAGLGETLWQVEIDPFCRAVLERHWPNAQRFEDVRSVGSSTLVPVDVLCGGFPCQDVSCASAGKRAGLRGERSGLWSEFRRVVEETTPPIVVVENVANGVRAWLGRVRADLHALGYRTRAVALSAFDCGAPHLRERVFVIAYADGDRKSAKPIHAEMARKSTDARCLRHWRDPFVGAPRMDDGLSGWVGVRALGNAIVPQCAFVIGRIIVNDLEAAP